MNVTAFDVAQRFVGTKEVLGVASNPAILAMLKLDDQWPQDDAVPWCSAFVNYIAWLLRLPRSKSLAARSWLLAGEPLTIEDAEVGNDIVILSRGTWKPGPEVIRAPGHVGFFAGLIGSEVYLLGGNQSDAVSVGAYPRDRILGVRRLA